ncbi:hypothetical protein P3342_006861 [Pyrenophora teres f. teres]|nr:hypothetical protein P3342_006861 [Pyrenophora teres f. teres]
MKKIMNQRANTSADLAEVLRIQRSHGLVKTKEQEEQQQKTTAYLDKRWEQIDALANAGLAKEKPGDNVKWLEGQIQSMDRKLRMKHNQKEADQKRLKAAKEGLETRLGKLKYALRKAEQFKQLQEDLKKRAEPANDPGAEAQLEELKTQARVLQDSLENPDPLRSKEELNANRELLAQYQSDISTLELAFKAKAQSEARDHYIARSVLPKALRKDSTKPYTLQGVSVRWADIQDAVYASGRWPAEIEHEPLLLNKARGETLLFRAEDYEIEKTNEVNRLMDSLRFRAESEEMDELESAKQVEGGQLQSGVGSIAQLLAKRNPVQRATA